MPAPSPIEQRLAKPMFLLSLSFLILLAGAIHRVLRGDSIDVHTLEARFLLGGLLVSWPIFLAEAVLRFRLRDRARRNLKTVAACLAVGLFPPLRLAARSARDPRAMWLPWLGWREVDFDLRKDLEGFFAVPMLLIALLILPVLVLEYGWADAVEARPPLRLALEIGLAVIWFAFTVEFLVRISAADRKLSYAFTNWIDLAVVLLPMVEFLPVLRVLRVTRVMRLRSFYAWVKYYRLYGLAGKGWRGLVVFRLIQLLWKRTPEARRARIRAQLDTKEQEREELDREIDYYRRQIEALQRETTEPPEDAPA